MLERLQSKKRPKDNAQTAGRRHRRRTDDWHDEDDGQYGNMEDADAMNLSTPTTHGMLDGRVFDG